MNNRGQNGNPNGTPQNHHPNQGYPQQNNQYRGNGYSEQNPQNFNRNVNNQNPYQNQNSQANNVNNSQFQGYSNGQNQPHNNMNNSQYRGQGYNAQSPQNNNMNNPQFRGQGYNGQNPQYNNMNNPQYRGQGNNGQNPQFGNNQNFNPMNRRPKMDSKMIGYITAAVAAILVVLMIFMFSSGSGKLGGRTPEEAVKNVISATKDGDSEKLGGATPEEAMRNYIAADKDGDLKKALNNCYFESDEARSNALAVIKNNEEAKAATKGKIDSPKKNADFDRGVGEVKYLDDDRASVEITIGGRGIAGFFARKQNGRWFLEMYA